MGCTNCHAEQASATRWRYQPCLWPARQRSFLDRHNQYVYPEFEERRCDANGHLTDKTIDGVSGVNVDKEVKAAIKLNIKTIVNDVEDVVPQIAELKIADSLLKEVENFVSGLVSQVVEEVSTTLKIVEDMIPVGKSIHRTH